MQTSFTIMTNGPGLYDFTREVNRWLSETSQDGLLTFFIQHTSASLLIQENCDPEVQTDIAEFLHRLVPPTTDPSMHYLTHVYEGPDDMPGHIKAALLPVSLSVPVRAGAMLLGRWQGIYVVEHRSAPHSRQVLAHLS